MRPKFLKLTFATKILLAYIVCLIFAVCAITVNQIHTTATVLEEESTQNLKMLTEQVALNFSEHQESTGYSVYSRMAALEIPQLMSAYNQETEKNIARTELRYALVQTVSDSSEYDYMVLQLQDGNRVNSGWKTTRNTGNLNAIHSNCNALLDAHQEITYGNSNWYREKVTHFFLLLVLTVEICDSPTGDSLRSNDSIGVISKMGS